MASVLLLIDQKARDLVSIKLIGYYLKLMNINVSYCNKFNMVSSCVKYKPDVLIVSSSEEKYADLARYVAPYCKLVLMTQEGACANKESTIMRHTFAGLGGGCYLNGWSRVYLWGSLSKKWLLDEDVYPAEIIRVVGTTRLDLYKIANSFGDQIHGRYRIGFANRGASINPPVKSNLIWDIDQFRAKDGSHRAYIDKDREWEDWIWHSMASIRVNLDLIEMLNENYEIIWRPDPYEDFSSYEFMVDKYTNVKINADPVLINFISSIDVLITEFSTTGIEALLLKKPVISTQRLLGDRLIDHNAKPNHINPEHMKFYWQPNTPEELTSILNGLKDGSLPYSPLAEEFEKYVYDIYGWKFDDVSSARKIADDVQSLIEAPKSPVLEKIHSSEYAEHPIFNRISKKYRIPIGLVRKFFPPPWLFDFYFIVKCLKSKSLAAFIRTEYISWFDWTRNKDISIRFNALLKHDAGLLKNQDGRPFTGV